MCFEGVPTVRKGSCRELRMATSGVRRPLDKVHIPPDKRRDRVINGEEGLQDKTIDSKGNTAGTRGEVKVEHLKR